jgi:photosystem II stability/assembly factor-like uncharacterized protein
MNQRFGNWALILLFLFHNHSFSQDEFKKGDFGLAQSQNFPRLGYSLLLHENFFSLTLGDKAVFPSSDEIWQSFPIYGGEMTSIAMDPIDPQTVYVGTRDAGVFKTTDGGLSWQPSRTGLTFYPIRSLQVDPQNPDILYAGTDFDGVWKSTDGGGTWFKSSNGLDESLVVFRLAIDPQNSNTIYAGLGGGVGLTIGHVYKSEDAGGTWEVKDNGIPRYGGGTYINAVFSFAIDPDDPSLLYAGTNFDGAFHSSNGGDLWVAINDSLPFMTNTDWRKSVNALATDPHHSNRLSAIISCKYFVFNAQNYWVQVNQDYLILGTAAAPLYFHPTEPEIIYSSGGIGGFYKSTDGGINWDNLKSGISEIAFHPTFPDTIYGTQNIISDNYGGVSKSVDQGVNWAEISQGITAHAVQSVAVDPRNPDYIYAGTGNGHFFRTQDGGATWDRGYHEISPIQISYYFGAIKNIVVDPLNSQYVYFVASNGFYKSTDGGEEFIKKDIGGFSFPRSIAIPCDASGPIYIGFEVSGHGIYKSYDGGETWTAKNEGLPLFGGNLTSILSIAIDPNDTSTVWAGTKFSGGIVKSTDGGDHWQVMGLTEENFVHAIAINPNNSDEILVGAGFFDGKLYKSTDGGSSWEVKLSEIAFVQDIVLDPRDSQLAYAATEGFGVMRSFDGGETWEEYNNGIFYPLIYSLDISQTELPFLVAGSYGSGLYWTYPSAEPTAIEQEENNMLDFSIAQNYPNPFNPITTIEYQLRKTSQVDLSIYNILGQKVTTLVSQKQQAGSYEVGWDATGFASGVYLYRLESDKGFIQTRKLIFLK